MKLVLDTCLLKLALFPRADNPAALIVELVLGELAEAWASPAMLDEYSDVLADEPDFLAEVTGRLRLCYPLTRLDVIRHAPDNRFLECALAVPVDFLITVNTARGHFDRRAYGQVRVATPGAFINQPVVQPLLAKL